MGQHYKVTTVAHCDKSVFMLIWPWVLPGYKTPTTKLLYIRVLTITYYIYIFYIYLNAFIERLNLCEYEYHRPPSINSPHSSHPPRVSLLTDNAESSLLGGLVVLVMAGSCLFRSASVISEKGTRACPAVDKPRYPLLFYVLATSKLISGRVLTCNSARSWWLYSTAPLEDQATSTQ